MMKVRVRRTPYSVVVQIDPFGEDGMFRDLIIVSQHKKLGRDAWGPAEINWHSLGIQGQERTLEFAHALNRAVGYAERLNLDHNAEIREQG